MILLRLHPAPSHALICAALEHDLPEFFLGDMPAPAKWGNPELAVAYTEAELMVCLEHGWTHVEHLIDEDDKNWLRGADILELIFWCEYCADALGHRAYEIMAERGRAVLNKEWVPHQIRNAYLHKDEE